MEFYNNQLDKLEGYHKGIMRILTWGIYRKGVGQQVSEMAIAIGRHVVLSMNLIAFAVLKIYQL